MKKTDKLNVIFVNGDNNKVYLDGARPRRSAIVIASIIFAISVTVLAISYCCPELLAVFIRFIFSIATNS